MHSYSFCFVNSSLVMRFSGEECIVSTPAVENKLIARAVVSRRMNYPARCVSILLPDRMFVICWRYCLAEVKIWIHFSAGPWDDEKNKEMRIMTDLKCCLLQEERRTEKKQNKNRRKKRRREKRKEEEEEQKEEEEEEILPPFPSLIFFHCEGRSGHSQLPIVALYSECLRLFFEHRKWLKQRSWAILSYDSNLCACWFEWWRRRKGRVGRGWREWLECLNIR